MGTRVQIAGPITIHVYGADAGALLDLAAGLHVQNATDRAVLDTTAGGGIMSKISDAMAKLTEEVAERKTVSEGLRAYIAGLKQQLLDLADAGAAADQILELANSIDADNAADAVLINSPVPPQPPAPPDEV